MRPIKIPEVRALVICLVIALFPAFVNAQVIRGTVVEAGSNKPIPAAFIELVDGVSVVGTTMTDSVGEFSLRTPRSGDVILRVRRIGYTAAQLTIKLKSVTGPLAPIPLQPEAVPFDPIVVPLESGVLEDRLKGLNHRRQLGAGYFINEQRLKNATGAPLSDVLRGVPGISVSNTKTPYGPLIFTNSNQIQSQLSPFRRTNVPNSAQQIGPCPMQLFVDGKHFRTDDLGIDIIKPQDLIAVEVFRTLAEVPGEFGGLHARCGVVSVWTRRVPSNGR